MSSDANWNYVAKHAISSILDLQDSTKQEVEVVAKEILPKAKVFGEVDESAPICSFFAKGNCTRGAACPYRHVAAGGVVAGGCPPATSSKGKGSGKSSGYQGTKPAPACIYFQKGTCTKGSLCTFSHVKVAGGGTTSSTKGFGKRTFGGGKKGRFG